MIAKDKRIVGRMNWEFGISRCKLFIQRMDKQQGPTVQHRELYSMGCGKTEAKLLGLNTSIIKKCKQIKT